ncbi:hypothetical protein R1flu_003125 [Riccia fluitans]|uniref:Uncharacterized protein n=1 Tax=Riccia fluitans TaxID=41844 RepID=A0ABD1Y842_9MARC
MDPLFAVRADNFRTFPLCEEDKNPSGSTVRETVSSMSAIKNCWDLRTVVPRPSVLFATAANVSYTDFTIFDAFVQQFHVGSLHERIIRRYLSMTSADLDVLIAEIRAGMLREEFVLHLRMIFEDFDEKKSNMKDPDLVIRGTNSSRVTSPDYLEAPVLGGAILKAQRVRDSKKLSWVRYEDLIKNRPAEDYGRSLSVSPNGASRRSSRLSSPENSQTPSRGPSPVGHVPSEQNKRAPPVEVRANFFQETSDVNFKSKSHVRFSASLPNLPIDSSPVQKGIPEGPLEAGLLRSSSPPTSPDLQNGPLSPSSPSSSPQFRRPSVVGLLSEEDRNLIFGSPRQEAEPPIQVTYTPRVPGDHAWREEQDENPPPVIERLDQQGLLLSVPRYLSSLRGSSRDGERRSPSPGFRPSNTAGVSVAASHRRSTFVRAVEAVTSLGTPVLAPSIERRTSKYVTSAPKKNSTVIVPVNAKQWLLQSLRMQDWELRELFDQMEMIPQLAADHVREVRAEWESLEARSLKVPPEADMLLKDQQLLERTKELLRRFITVVSEDGEDVEDELQDRSPVQGASPDLHEETTAPDIRAGTQTPQPNGDVHAQHETSADEAQREQIRKERDSFARSTSRGSTSPLQLRSGSVLGRPVCPACGRLDGSAPNTIIRGGVLPRESVYQERAPSIPHQNLPSFIPFEDYVIKQAVVKPTGKSDQFKTTYSPLDKRWYTVLFPALQPGKREDVTLLSEWLMHASQKNSVEDSDGHFANVEMAFVLHCVAFLEIVRQVRIHCEERGDMILHVWRQLLRIFNQVHFLPDYVKSRT